MWVQKALLYRGAGCGKEVRRDCSAGQSQSTVAHRPRWGPLQLVWLAQDVVNNTPLPNPSVPNLTLFLMDVPPAIHPAVITVLEFRGGGQDTDGLDVLIEGDGGGQLQQGAVVLQIIPGFGVYNNTLHPVTMEVGPQAPNGWCDRQLAKLDRPFIGISVAGRGGESWQGSSEGGWAT